MQNQDRHGGWSIGIRTVDFAVQSIANRLVHSLAPNIIREAGTATHWRGRTNSIWGIAGTTSSDLLVSATGANSVESVG
jgi:hypothetical protein